MDALLVVDPEVKATRLRWLATGPVEASPAEVRAEVAKLEYLRGLGADTLDLSVPLAERRRCLAAVGRRLTGQTLERREPQRRYPILLTLPAQSATDVFDEVVQLFDQAVSARESKIERRMRDALAERGRSGEDRQALLDDMVDIVFDLGLTDAEISGLIRGERISWPRLRAARAQSAPRLPRDHGHLAALDASYGYLRQFTPQVLAAVTFVGGTAAAEMLATVDILRELNATGARRVPAGAPDGFVPAGDVHVPGSRSYSDPVAYLLTRTSGRCSAPSSAGARHLVLIRHGVGTSQVEVHRSIPVAPWAWPTCPPAVALMSVVGCTMTERRGSRQDSNQDCRWSLLDSNHAMHSAQTRPHPWRRRRLPCSWWPIPVVLLPVLLHLADPSRFERQRRVQQWRWRWPIDSSALVAGQLSRHLQL